MLPLNCESSVRRQLPGIPSLLTRSAASLRIRDSDSVPRPPELPPAAPRPARSTTRVELPGRDTPGSTPQGPSQNWNEDLLGGSGPRTGESYWSRAQRRTGGSPVHESSQAAEALGSNQRPAAQKPVRAAGMISAWILENAWSPAHLLEIATSPFFD